MDEKRNTAIDLNQLGSGKLEFICESGPNDSSFPSFLSTRLKTNRSSYPLRFIVPRTSGNYELFSNILLLSIRIVLYFCI